MAVAGGKYNINAEITRRDPETNIAVPVSLSARPTTVRRLTRMVSPANTGRFATNRSFPMLKPTEYLKKLLRPEL